MAENWSERERRTNHLIRSIAGRLFTNKSVSPDQLLGLIRLTWITVSPVNKDTYIKSVKLPALGKIFDQNYSKMSLAEVARDVAERIETPGVERLVLSHTGFTNIYNAYRNSSADWLRSNFPKILPLSKKAYRLTTDAQGRSLAEAIDRLPPIAKPDQTSSAMHPASLLTPLLFALDGRVRFPIINGREHVQNILTKKGVDRGSLAQKYNAMISLYGKGEIRDAADLDQISDELENFLGHDEKPPKKKLLRGKRLSGKHLPLKDESDLKVVQKERAMARKKLHNHMTNRLRELWADYTLTEGAGTAAQYDVLVKNYNGEDQDLLVEVKSSTESANLRMAVGQLFSYSYRLNKKREYDLCVLLPGRPTQDEANWLKWLDIGLMWFSGNELDTDCDWLSHLA